MPPLAVAALADAVAARGQQPSAVINSLRIELAEKIANGTTPLCDEASEEAAISRLELEMCHGPPRDKCAKCRRAPRDARMEPCGHLVLFSPCLGSVQAHLEHRSGMLATKLSRLLCPVCRGFEAAESTDAESLFSILDTNANGSIEPAELLVHLLVAGQEPETVAELFLQMDVNGDGLISPTEWRDGYERFVALASEAPARALQASAPPKHRLLRRMSEDDGSDEGDNETDDGRDDEAGGARLPEDVHELSSEADRPVVATPPLVGYRQQCAADADDMQQLDWDLSVKAGLVQVPLRLNLSMPATPR